MRLRREKRQLHTPARAIAAGEPDDRRADAGDGDGDGDGDLDQSFSGPDGRALFTIGPDSDGEPLPTWLAIGYHNIYQ
jgi:hypothetical protein